MQYPLPTRQSLSEYYAASYENGLYREFVEASAMKEATAERRFARISRHLRAGRLLDVGCADGRFVEHARSRGVQAEGIDPSAAAVRRARERGQPVTQGRVHEYEPAHRFEVITAFDVIEHVIDPRRFLEAIHRLLAPDGVVILSTPNLDSLFRRLMGKRWFFYIPEEHLHYFAPRSLRALLARVGFEVLHCSPTAKPLTYAYGLTQFAEFNPWIYRVMRAISVTIPERLRQRPISFSIGEMMVIARRQG